MIRKHRIAIVIQYQLHHPGGVEVLVRQLIEGLKGFYEIVLVSDEPAGGGTLGSYRDAFAAHIPWGRDQTKITIRTSADLAGQLKALGVELAHFHFSEVYGFGSRISGRCPMIACDRAGIPVLISTHVGQAPLEGYCGPNKPLWLKLALFPAAWLSRLHVVHHARKEFTDSRYDMRQMRRIWWPLRSRFDCIYHSRIKENEGRPLEEVPRQPIILNVGSVCERKGQLTLLKAFSRLAGKFPEWRLLFVGDAGEEAYASNLERAVREYNLSDRVCCLGQRPSREVDDWMYRASIFALPSLNEGLPLVLQEALFCGCPVIGSRVNGVPEMIDPEANGLLVEPGNVDALTGALERLMSDAMLRRKFSANARSSILRKRMTAEGMLKTHQEHYESVLGNIPNRRLHS